MATEITILIADDHPIFRQGLRQVIEREPSIRVVAEAEDGEAVLASLRELRPDVTLLDIDMPKLDGFGVARAARREELTAGLVFLTMHKDEDMVHEALDLGVRGYVVKDSAVTEIVVAVRAVAAGQRYFSPAVATHLINWSTRSGALRRERAGLDLLT
ncbi:MAG: response regulator, partial [Pyrinomonadaceae bacterium]